MTRRTYYLYQYTQPASGKSYIGVTCNLKERAYSHRTGRRTSGRAFRDAILKYGFHTFQFQLLALFDDKEAVAYHEQEAIRKFNTLSPNGYNLTAGAPYTRYNGPPSEETRALLRIANKREYTAERRQQARDYANRIRLAKGLPTIEEEERIKEEKREKRRQEREERPGINWRRLPAYREKVSERFKELWSNPEYRGRMLKRKSGRPGKVAKYG